MCFPISQLSQLGVQMQLRSLVSTFVAAHFLEYPSRDFAGEGRSRSVSRRAPVSAVQLTSTTLTPLLNRLRIEQTTMRHTQTARNIHSRALHCVRYSIGATSPTLVATAVLPCRCVTATPPHSVCTVLPHQSLLLTQRHVPCAGDAHAACGATISISCPWRSCRVTTLAGGYTAAVAGSPSGDARCTTPACCSCDCDCGG